MNIQLKATLLSTALLFSSNAFANAEDNKTQSKETSVLLDIQSNIKIDKEVHELRQKDALEAVIETNNALLALENNQTKEAIESIEFAIGKLAVVLTRDPSLGLKAIDATKSIHKLDATPEVIKLKIKAAKQHLDDGELQEARALLSPLVSEVLLTVTSIPLNGYSKNLKALIPLIDDKKINEAKMQLSSLLNTLVIKSIITPIPPLEAKNLLFSSEALAAKENRSEEENKLLTYKLKEARKQLEISELLGYGDKKLFKPIYEQLDEVEKNTVDGKATKGLFEGLKTLVPDFIKS